MPTDTLNNQIQSQSKWQSQIPEIAWGTLWLFIAYLIGYAVVLKYALNGSLAYPWATLCCAYLTYVGFTIVHDAGHGSIFKANSQYKWLEPVLGWVTSIPLLLVPFPLFKIIHDRHHAFTNDPSQDPDHFTFGDKWYQVVLNCLFIPIQYHLLSITTLRSNPAIKRTYPTTLVYLLLIVSTLIFAIESGYIKELFYFLLLPNLIAVFWLVMFFDYLPHHPHKSLDRYHNSRIYPSKILNMMLLGQNYHLIHHLYPKIPWYKYQQFFGQLLPELKANNAPIEYIFSSERPKFMQSTYTQTLPNEGRFINMSLKVRDIKNLTSDAVLVEFSLPYSQKLHYKAGQYITVSHKLNGVPVTRCYSICSSPKSDTLKIGVQLVSNGAMSSFINHQLVVQQEMVVKGPFGDFIYPSAHNEMAESLVLIAGGSGITPIISILKTALDTPSVGRIQLIYTASRQEKLMFTDQLNTLLADHLKSLKVTYILTQQANCQLSTLDQAEIIVGKRLDKSLLTELLHELECQPHILQDTLFYICGPEGLSNMVISTLENKHLDSLNIHCEQFTPAKVQPTGKQHCVELTLTSGDTHSLSVATNQTILDVANDHHVPLQYACTNGVCGSCKCKVEKGHVKPLSDNLPGITQEEQLLGYTLACQCYPLSNVTLLEVI